MTGIELYTPFLDDQIFISRWKSVCQRTDGCSSGILKKLIKFVVHRIYRVLCIQHDFDYEWGIYYGMTQAVADADLRDGILEIAYSKKWFKRWIYKGIAHS
ncbi:MAG: hypothetical protein KAS32_10935, partial [Candidatus Peribacteraceae bacterium]|nr:hypothetical protein [Candidatus Peribacteraceae bacterium]